MSIKNAQEWNARYRIGQAVRYHPVLGDGAVRLTHTTSRAWLLNDDTPVVMVGSERDYVPLMALTIVIAPNEPAEFTP